MDEVLVGRLLGFYIYEQILIMVRSSVARRSEATFCNVDSLAHRAKIALLPDYVQYLYGKSPYLESLPFTFSLYNSFRII
jgi:hypothetical protein